MNNKKELNPPINPGISLLLVVFLVLCLFTFSAITLTSSINEFNRAKALSENTKDFYTAANRAEHDLSDIVSGLSSQGKFTIDAPIENSYDIDDTQSLSVRIEPLAEPIPGKYYTITKWQVIQTETWETNETLDLFIK